MSSVSGESDVTADKEDGVAGVGQEGFGGFEDPSEGIAHMDSPTARLREIIAEEQEEVSRTGLDGSNGASFGGYKNIKKEEAPDSPSELAFRPSKNRINSPEGSVSTPDDTPSIQGSKLSSPGSSVPPSHASFSRAHPGALRPFERRFSARLSPSPLSSPRAVSPAFFTPASRQSSLSSQLLQHQDEPETPQPPWEVVRWTRLKKISSQVFSEIGRRNFGKPTCITVAANIVIGTSKGLILVFDYQQVLKSIIGPGTKAVECGSVTSLAISADHTTVAGGHATGHIFTWELARPAKPFLHIPPLDRAQLDNRRSDGHVSGVAVLHVGFLGTRHTALVSADDGGMAFSHLATRGLGAVGRTVKTTRILGRYPLTPGSIEKPRKASSVLAFAPLPLGNVPQQTDDMGLTAILTPYLLVIVSTTPIAQTQHKASRPKEIAPHSTLSGCLAWFPAVKLKQQPGTPQQAVSKTKLVYCWSNILTILDVETTPAEDKDKPPELAFKPRSRWRGEEAIVAVQWISRSVLAVLTVSQRLIILEDNTLRMTDSFDLIHKHIFHQDLFSHQLHGVVEQLDEEDSSLHGVVADAFYMSFKAYKGRLFLLGFNDVSIGTLSNWADRLLGYMEDGDFIAAIELATSYYNGDTDKLTVGLPENDVARHGIVREKLLEMISASLRYSFGRLPSPVDEEVKDRLKQLAQASFTACLSMREFEFLFEEVYEAYSENSLEGVFFETLEPYVLDEEITSIPPDVLKDLITYFAAARNAERLEEMICRLNTMTMDIDQVTSLCRQHNLYEALIYVWTQALHDYVTPLIDLLSLIKVLLTSSTEDEAVQDLYLESAMKIFPYLAYTLTGRTYPSGVPLDSEEDYKAKTDIYNYLLAGKNVPWPKGSKTTFYTRADKGAEPSFPYLRLILAFDTPSFMSMLNEAFEDSFLNGDQGDVQNGDAPLTNGNHHGSSLTPTRQYIINLLNGIMTSEDFKPEDTIYFYMFVARNLPKFPQYIILPGTSLHNILVGLCNYPTPEVQEDCQLSVEYLLSIYHPADLPSLVPLFEKAGFHRVLKSVYKGSKQYAKLLEAYLNDADNRESVFDCIGDCLRPSSGLTRKQITEVHGVILENAKELASIDAPRFARTLEHTAKEILTDVLDKLEDESESQFLFLRQLVEPEENIVNTSFVEDPSSKGFAERYVQLMCQFHRTHVADFVGLLKSGDLRLEPVLPALEKSGVVDAEVVLLARDGMVKNAMERLVKHLHTLETALTGLIEAAAEAPDVANTEEAVSDLLEAVDKYCKVGIWLCQGQSRTMQTHKSSDRRHIPPTSDPEAYLELDELLWLELIDTIVRLTKNVTAATHSLDTDSQSLDTTHITTSLRTAVQQAFNALLAATAADPTRTVPGDPPSLNGNHKPPATFLLILRAFLRRAAASSPSLSDLRHVLAEIFSAYAFEHSLLALATRFLDQDAFGAVATAHARRQQGWRPRTPACEACRKRAWGPGAGAAEIWEAWARKEKREARRKTRERVQRRGGEEAERVRRGKGPVEVDEPEELELDDGGGGGEGEEGWDESAPGTPGTLAGLPGAGAGRGAPAALVVFACRHVWHLRCLERVRDEAPRPPQEEEEEAGFGLGLGRGLEDGRRMRSQRLGGRLKCPLCA